MHTAGNDALDVVERAELGKVARLHRDEVGEDVVEDINANGKQFGQADGTISAVEHNAASFSNEIEEICV